MMRPAFIVFALLLSPAFSAAQDTQFPPNSPPARRIEIPPGPGTPGTHGDFENWFLEFTVGDWQYKPTGTVTSQSVPNDMKNDLGIAGWKSQPIGRIAAQLDRNKLVIEGTRYELNGGKTVQETVQADGKTVALDDATEAHIKLNYVYVGYERDLFSGSHGFFGLTGGGTFLQSNSNLIDDTRMITQYSFNTGIFPILGGAFRWNPLHSYIFNVNGESKGMNLGNFGFYLHSSANLGLTLTPNFTIQAGYSRLGMDFQNKYDVAGIRAVFKGPTVSVQWRIRM